MRSEHRKAVTGAAHYAALRSSCRKHPFYEGTRAPSEACRECTRIWELELADKRARAARAKLIESVDRARERWAPQAAATVARTRYSGRRNER